MSLDDFMETSQARARGDTCVVIAADDGDQRLEQCLESVHRHTPANTSIVTVDASTDAVNRALDASAPADVVLLSEPCRVSAGWLTRLREAALEDTNTASASALIDTGTALALCDPAEPIGDLSQLASSVAEHAMRLRPRLRVIVGPCVYLRRDAVELIGPLDAGLELDWSLEVDFAQRCLLAGLAHVAADDVAVGHLTPGRLEREEPPALLRERYPDLDAPVAELESGEYPAATPAWASVAASSALPRALEAARRPRSQLWVTIDGRALGSTITGTQRHILELITALSATGSLRLRVLVGPDTSSSAVEQLRSLPGTDVLAIGDIHHDTPRSTIFHRPQQVFETGDLRLALRLGERFVLNQLDLIAYRNPAYHPDAATWRSHRRAGRQALGAANRIVVFSNHTRLDLLSDELTTDARVRVVPPGLDHRAPMESRQPTIAPGSAGATADALDRKPFMLCLGSDFRHKNRVFALRLLAELRERHRWDGRLVLAGMHIPYGSSRELEHELLEHQPELRDAVIELGSIDEQEKVWLMERAAAVVYPSVYEGFGLVPLEAALSGVPCVFAPQSSLAEVLPAQTAAIVPWDVRDSAARAYELLEDPAARALQVRTLADVAEGLTWEDAANSTIEIYREAAVASVRESAELSRDEAQREHELHEMIAAHDALVARLVGERAHAQRMYDELNAEVGFALSLIGPHGTLPEDVQRALLALSAKPALGRTLYGAGARTFRAMRALSRIGRGASDPPD